MTCTRSSASASAPAPEVVARSATEAVERSLAAMAADRRDGIWITRIDPDAARAAAAEVDRRVAAGEHVPLAGLTLAVKDNIDVAGLPTTAGCPAYAYRPSDTAPAVAALVAAGAVVMGKTNLDQFATGLVGTRSPYGRCPNAWRPELVSGGSSSGSAVAVAAGHVDLALGTDTAGSGRVPAAANGIVGLKPTRGRIPTEGVVPAMASIDCVSVFARSVALAEEAAGIAGSDPGGSASPPTVLGRDRVGDPPERAPDLAWGVGVRLGVPSLGVGDFDGDPAGPTRFAAAVDHVLAVDPAASMIPVDLRDFVATGRLLYDGAFVAERYAAVGPFIDAHRDEVDPVVGAIIAAAGHLPAWQLYRDRTELCRLRRLTEQVWHDIDVLVVPTVPRLPTVAEVRAEPVAVNSMLGTYTNFVNLLDLCAITIPVPIETEEQPPASITLIAPAGGDRLVSAVARRALPGSAASPRTP